ncbi:sugar ABC transporter substrate-binding protein [Caldiplasma sukawensis]
MKLGPYFKKYDMSRKKVFLAVAITAIFVLSGAVFAFQNIQQTGSPSAHIIAQPQTSNQVTITVWGAGSPGGEQEVFNETCKYFESVYPNVTVQDNPAVNVASSTFSTAAASGKAPDIYRDTSNDGGVLFESGYLLNLSQYLPSSFFSNFTTGTISDWTINGAIYGVPVNTNGVGLYYNKRYVTTPPTTINQLIKEAENITKNDTYNGNPVYGLAYALGADYGYRAAAWWPAFGGQIFNSAGQPTLNSSAGIQAISLLYNFTYKYKISPTGITSTKQENELFEDNQSAFIIEGPWCQSKFEAYLGKNLSVAPLPENSATGDWVSPIWGSVGYEISSPAASGINAHQLWASIQFIKMLTNFTAQKNLFLKAGDFPSLTSVGSYISANATARAQDPLISGWVAQEQHTQIQPNYVSIQYYWPNFHTYIGNLYDNGTNNVTSTMNAFQHEVQKEISQLNEKPVFLSNTDIIIIVVVLVVLVAIVAVVAVSRRKKGGDRDSGNN